MEERFWQYLLGHPAAALVFLAGAFWARQRSCTVTGITCLDC